MSFMRFSALLICGVAMAFSLEGLEQYYEAKAQPFDKVELTDQQWRAKLPYDAYRILRKGKTEPSFSHKYNDNKAKGIYHCRACSHPLFSSKAKFDSGTGWPSFTFPYRPDSMTYHDDYFLIIKRTELKCARCDSHLGHVFTDGPQPTGLRFCINGLALDFRAAD